MINQIRCGVCRVILREREVYVSGLKSLEFPLCSACLRDEDLAALDSLAHGRGFHGNDCSVIGDEEL